MKDISLYIHVPFCKQKCKYCDFPSFCGKENLMNEYIDCLCVELDNVEKKYSFNTIFIGGGTPSYLENDELKKLLEKINKLSLNKSVEFSIECNPGTLDKEKLELMKSYGVNRLSLGLQSSNDSLLKEIGRIHSFDDFKENYLLAREVGFRNINVDLMFGLPNQSLTNFKETLEKIVELSPEHISAYSLIIEEGTSFYNLWESGKLTLPSEEEEREMYEFCVNFLESKGYNQYEISNFSKNNKQCKHNLVYWELNDYLGCGSSSASLLNGTRIKNYDQIEDYIASVKNQGHGRQDVNATSKEELMEEFVFLGLRKINGIEEKEFLRRFSISMEELYSDVINKHCKNGLLIKENGKIYLSKEGIQLSNYVMSDFLLS